MCQTKESVPELKRKYDKVFQNLRKYKKLYQIMRKYARNSKSVSNVEKV